MSDNSFLDNVLGFFSLRKEEEIPIENQQLPGISAPENVDAATDIEIQTSGSHILHNFTMQSAAKNTKELINTYRETARIPEVNKAVEEIVNQAIVTQADLDPIVEINLKKTKFSEAIQKKIQNEFENICALYNFDRKAEDMFKDWYIDSRIAYHKIYDPKNKSKGIQELRKLDARYLEKVRIVEKETLPNGVSVVKSTKEYWVYKPESGDSRYKFGVQGSEIKIPVSAIVFSHSGLYDACRSNIISYIDQAIKPANALKMLEDAAIIYRLARAPERRVFYVDVGQMPKNKAEQYMKNIMDRFKNKIVYDSATGKLKSKHDTQSILEDYWLPRRDGSKGTQIDTLPGGANLGQVEELQYYKRNLYESLMVPYSRFDIENEGGGSFDLGRPSEVTREELRFARFVSKLQRKFSDTLLEPLKTQLILKGIITPQEWEINKNYIKLIYNTDTYYEEIKEMEIMQGRIDLVNSMEDSIGKYYSHKYIMDNILKQSEEEQEQERSRIEEEKKDSRFRDNSEY